MKPRTFAVLAVAIAAVAAIATSCTTQTSLVSSWELPGDDIGPFHKVVVIAVMRDKDHSKAFETAEVQQLDKDGVDAIPGFTVLNGRTDLSLEQMQKLVDKTGADAVMVSKVIAVNHDYVYNPPTDYDFDGAPYPYWWDDPYWGYYNPYPYHYWGYWYPAVQVTGTPGYWTASSTYRVETTVYRTSDNRLVWTAMSKTYNPDSEYDLGKSLTRRLTTRLEHSGIIAATNSN